MPDRKFDDEPVGIVIQVFFGEQQPRDARKTMLRIRFWL